MKKILTLAALLALAGCSGYYDYYKGGVRYTQDGDDCIYSSDEYARHYSRDVNAADIDKRIVYRNTRCADLYARDTIDQTPRTERRVLTPANETAFEEPSSSVPAVGPVITRHYTVTPVSTTSKKSCKKTTKQYVVLTDM